jgi:hypothetical protein
MYIRVGNLAFRLEFQDCVEPPGIPLNQDVTPFVGLPAMVISE